MKILRLSFFALLILCSLSLHAQMAPAGLPKSKAQFNALTHKASQGDLYAQYTVAYCYMNGIDGVVGVKFSKGKKMLQDAADKGCAEACHLIYKLEPVENEYYRDQAVAIYKKQATGEAFYKIADLYSNDRLVCQRWLKTAMDFGYAKAQSDLSAMYNRQANKSDYDSFATWLAAIEPYSKAAISKTKEDTPRAVSYDDLDTNIPETDKRNTRTIAVIIGNEHYQKVPDVPYAANDATIFAQYCEKTLGIPAVNIRSYSDATYGTIVDAVSDMKSIVDAYKGDINVIFYYSGHGIPNEQSRKAFLLPVDADGKNTDICYPLNKLYDEMNNMKVNSVVAFLDACFSGSMRKGDGTFASAHGAHGVAMVAKKEIPQGNTVVFSAATGDETAYPYTEKEHGMFTYFLLKKLQQTKGNCTLGELSQYVEDNVKQKSVLYNRKTQTPTVDPSPAAQGIWQSRTLR